MSDFLRTLASHRETLETLDGLADRVEAVGRRLGAVAATGGTVFWAGNGGSAAESQHLAAELVGRFEGLDRPGVRSFALTTDTSVLTSIGNDLGFARVFARQVESVCREGDALVALSTSGASDNITAAVRAAGPCGVYTVGLSGGDGGELARIADDAIVVPGRSAARIQEAHLVIGHYWCEAIYEAMD